MCPLPSTATKKIFICQGHIIQVIYIHILFRVENKCAKSTDPVSNHVFLQPTRECKWFFAIDTFVWFLAGVGCHVPLPNLRSGKGLATVTTFVWLFSWVDEHVCLQVSILPEWFVAHCTLEWFLLSVGEHVRLQVSISCKWLVAYGTFVLPCSRVGELTILEISTIIECLVALSTLEWLLSSVSSHVPHQTCGCAKWFSTQGTFVRLLSIMSRQVHCKRCDLVRNLPRR